MSNNNNFIGIFSMTWRTAVINVKVLSSLIILTCKFDYIIKLYILQF